MRAVICAALLLVTVAGCSSISEDQRFEELGHQYLEEFTALSPVSATFLGDHRFDSELDRVTEEMRDEEIRFLEQILADLGNIDRSRLAEPGPNRSSPKRARRNREARLTSSHRKPWCLCADSPASVPGEPKSPASSE